MTSKSTWTDGAVARLRREIATEADKGKHPCAAVATIAKQEGISSTRVRELIARAEREASARGGKLARDVQPQIAVGVDLYSVARGGLIEKLARMAGRAISYTPRCDGGLRDPVPWEHTLAAVVEWLARNEESPHDVAGDVIVGLAMMHSPHVERISRALAATMLQSWGAARSMQQSRLDACCTATVMQCITGFAQPFPPRATAAQVGLMQGFGVRAVWVMADRGLKRAAEALA